ncbi:hypothetical protein RhiXN_06548 [Rhizoctonia solani]|uniref:BTB domain-containing protein n=1 Tax=Rhizoctonia solani TaxID=456999 RepID=A0A8H8NX62_9AGAM|nr:uncharacterized protein RhiXN_06548 [Rhizoctonia solani]QRW21559.1 hypothetical protein RhiXN_06548 [Rhizoctonia solani]
MQAPLRSSCLPRIQLQAGRGFGPDFTRSLQTSIKIYNQPPEPSLPREDYTEAQWLDYLHRVSFTASQSQKLLAELDVKNPDAGVFDAPNRIERAYALIFQLFLFLSRPQPDSSPEHYLQTFETIPSFDGDDLHLARLCAIHILKTIVWELDSIPTSDPQRTKYPNVFEDAKGLSMLCAQFLKDQDSVPETWPVFWSEAQQALVALGMDLGDAGYAIQAPPDPSETPDTDPDAPGLTRAEGFKGVDLTGNAGAPSSPVSIRAVSSGFSDIESVVSLVDQSTYQVDDRAFLKLPDEAVVAEDRKLAPVHPEFAFSDGTTMNQVFWVHEIFINKFSVLAALIQRAKASNTNLEPGSRIVLVCEPKIQGADIFNTLKVIYASYIDGIPDFDSNIMISALRIASIFDYPNLRKFALSRLEGMSLSALHRIQLSDELLIPSWEMPAFVELCNRAEPITLTEADVLGMSRFVEIARIRETQKGHQVTKLVNKALPKLLESSQSNNSSASESTQDESGYLEQVISSSSSEVLDIHAELSKAPWIRKKHTVESDIDPADEPTPKSATRATEEATAESIGESTTKTFAQE